jgi:hypothetical protein
MTTHFITAEIELEETPTELEKAILKILVWIKLVSTGTNLE